jgi:hypothetical protein
MGEQWEPPVDPRCPVQEPNPWPFIAWIGVLLAVVGLIAAVLSG